MNTMIAQIESVPDLIRTQQEELDKRIRTTFNHNELLSIKKIIITGCGDSYFAGAAAKMAFQRWCQMPVEVDSSLQAGRYRLPYEARNFPNNPLVIGISVSGGVTRTIEAVHIANDIGAFSLALTGNPQSDLAKTADKTIHCEVPDFADAPGVRSYQVSLMALYLLALHIAEVKGSLMMGEADGIRAEIQGLSGVIEDTIKANKSGIKSLAEKLRDETNYHFISHGPNLATASFCAAKVVESAGMYAVAQDTEEWAHFEYFNIVNPAVPTFVLSPGYRTHGLLSEFVQQMKRIGRLVMAVTPENDTLVAPRADFHYPVIGPVREELSPFVYKTAGELFAAFLADAAGEKFFRRGNDKYAVATDHRRTTSVRLADLT